MRFRDEQKEHWAGVHLASDRMEWDSTNMPDQQHRDTVAPEKRKKSKMKKTFGSMAQSKGPETLYKGAMISRACDTVTPTPSALLPSQNIGVCSEQERDEA